jgi:ribosomal protein L15
MRHRSGHVERGSAVELPPDAGAGRNGMQARRSALSYAKRGLTMDYWDLRVIGADNDAKTAEPISQKQADEINDMLKELGMDAEAKKRFLKFAEADSVSKIQAHNFEKCLRALEQKRRQA